VIETPDLRPYQIEAIDSWQANGCRGLLEMATGTGKTITALSCARVLLNDRGQLVILVLVPTLDLSIQWAAEVRQWFSKNVILANSKIKNWYKECFELLNTDLPTFAIITTYATFLTAKFQHLTASLPDETLLIADEVHNFGTLKHISLYPQHIRFRLGLSATPDRYFDEEGSAALSTYFNVAEKPTYQFGMKEAIASGFLCEYYYYPKLVSLTTSELNEYKEISHKLMRFFDTAAGKLIDSPAVTALLLKRKRIIHQAAGKLPVFKEIMTALVEEFNPLKYLLVYVPEGNDMQVDEDDIKLIDQYSAIIARDFKLSQHQYIGGTANREQILDQFAKGKIAVLTAMKCLDEGVDVRRAEIAVFCSSTGNPRQFVQRRGRILRTHPDKKYATIYDLVVAPEITDQYFEDTLQMEKSILQGEFRRVHEFAGLALNKYQALASIDVKAKEFNIDIFSPFS
jgi:superfamily II DNA or RNA helicase